MDTRHSTDYHVEEGVPSVAEYGRLRQAVGWSELPFEAIEAGLVTSLYGVCAFHEGELVGCGWSIGAPYRELIAKLNAYRKQGVPGVDMETSAMYALGQFRGVRVCYLLVVSDELWSEWNPALGTEGLQAATKRAEAVIERLLEADNLLVRWAISPFSNQVP
jgi:uridine phosphorylase